MKLRNLYIAVTLTILGCSGTQEELPDGELLYSQTMPAGTGNTFACETCHALSEPASDGFVRPGHPIGDATRRPNYKGGQTTDMLEAVNTCLEEWMRAEPWTADSPEWLALHGWLDEQASAVPEGGAATVPLEIVQPPTDLTGGDMTRGNDLFNHRCIVCHGENAVGTERAPQLAGTMLDPSYIATRIRTSGSASSRFYDGLSFGAMPFWGADRLSDQELRDIVVWLFMSELPGGQGGDDDDTTGDDDDTTGDDDDTTGDDDDSAGDDDDSAGDDDTAGDDDDTAGDDDDAPVSACGGSATHARVGSTAVLVNHFHDISGTATIVDDCTVRIDAFGFDGNGINVQIYAGQGGNYSSGFSLSENLVNFPIGYQNETLWLTLPITRTLDEVDGLSVWCVPVGVSFGDGLFSP